MMQAVKPESVSDFLSKRRTTISRQIEEVREPGASGYNTPFFRPATKLNPNNIWLRRMTRIVRHLRDDLARVHPNDIMPTTWMIRCLLASMTRSDINALEFNQFDMSDEQWDKSLLTIMQKLYDYSDSSEHIRNAFFELDGFTPLFPNQELFGPQHAHKFAQLALNYLNTSLAST